MYTRHIEFIEKNMLLAVMSRNSFMHYIESQHKRLEKTTEVLHDAFVGASDSATPN